MKIKVFVGDPKNVEADANEFMSQKAGVVDVKVSAVSTVEVVLIVTCKG